MHFQQSLTAYLRLSGEWYVDYIGCRYRHKWNKSLHQTGRPLRQKHVHMLQLVILQLFIFWMDDKGFRACRLRKKVGKCSLFDICLLFPSKSFACPTNETTLYPMHKTPHSWYSYFNIFSCSTHCGQDAFKTHSSHYSTGGGTDVRYTHLSVTNITQINALHYGSYHLITDVIIYLILFVC